MNSKLGFMLARQVTTPAPAAPDPTPLSVTVNELGDITGYTVDGIPHTATYLDGTLTLSDGSNSFSLSKRDLGLFVPTVKSFLLSQETMSFSEFTGTNAAPQTFIVSANDDSAVPVTISESISWASCSPTSGTTPLTVTVTPNQTGLAASGTPYAGNITITPTGYESQALTLPADYEVKAIVSTFNLRFSTSVSRSSPAVLAAATLTGNNYVFVEEDPAILSVDFFIDNATPSAPTGSPFHTENSAPWDFNGTNTSTQQAIAYDFATLSAGTHTISARVNKTTAAGGGSIVITASFTKGGSAPAPGPVRKLNPGHYALVGTNSSNVGNILSQIAGTNFKGVYLSLFWGNIETTTQGVYNWTVIDSALAQCAAAGKKLIISMPWVWFNNQNLTPAYIKTNTTYAGGEAVVTSVDTYKKWIKVWHTATRARWIAFLQALAARYDANPTFEAIILEEMFGPTKSASATISNFTDFTAQGFIDGQNAVLAACNAAFLQTNVYGLYNWNAVRVNSTSKWDVQIFIETGDSFAGGMALPDTVPGDAVFAKSLLQARQLQRPFMTTVADKSTFPRIRSGVDTYQRIIDWATTDPAGYKCHYMCWTTWSDNTAGVGPRYSFADAKTAVIAANYQINSTVPTGID